MLVGSFLHLSVLHADSQGREAGELYVSSSALCARVADLLSVVEWVFYFFLFEVLFGFESVEVMVFVYLFSV